MTGFELLCGLVIVFLGFYYYLIHDYDFWKRRGIPGPKPVPVFGNFKNTLLGKISIGDEMGKYYTQYKHVPVIGLFIRKQRVLGVLDPDIIKTILIKDFSKFADRGLKVNEVVSW